MTVAIKAKPGIWKGILFRSQLEIAYAKWFEGSGVAWEYVDETWYDFLVLGHRDLQLYVEVKPPIKLAVQQAIERFDEIVWGPDWDVESTPMIVVGQPNGPYAGGHAAELRPSYDTSFEPFMLVHRFQFAPSEAQRDGILKMMDDGLYRPFAFECAKDVADWVMEGIDDAM